MRKGAIALVAALALCVGVAEGVLIDFESDPVGGKPNGWTSADSSIAHFSGQAASLEVGDYAHQSHGHGLVAIGDAGGSLRLDFDVPVRDISLEFGNDDPYYDGPDSRMLLTLFMDAAQVGQTSVLCNMDDIMNQTISIFGVCFNGAVVVYTDANLAPSILWEVVDNISFTECPDQDVPEPTTLVMLALAGAGLALRKRMLG